MKKKPIYLALFLWLFTFTASAQSYQFKESSFVYKTVDGHQLEMHAYLPQVSSSVRLPAIVFFFGGGWVGGNPDQFRLQSEYFATRGIAVFCPEYRTKSKHGTTPFESVKDAKSAMRYLKTHGEELGIDTARIVAGGGSAGGHLAACTATIEEINEKTDDLSISPKPVTMVLFNPVVDTGKRGYGQEKLEGREFELSPVHHITENVPPTLILHGRNDKTVPFENVRRFKHSMEQMGNKCVLVAYKNQGHGFFNYSNSPEYFEKTLKRVEKYLDDNGFLRGESWANRYCKSLRESKKQ